MGPKSKDPVFTRQVPAFLSNYAHLLTTNKKNYLNENTSGEPVDDDYRDQVESKTIEDYKTAYLVDPKNDDNTMTEIDYPVSVERPFTYDATEPSDPVKSNADPEEACPDEEGTNKRKIVFQKRTSQKQPATGDVPSGVAKKKQKILLSFDDCE